MPATEDNARGFYEHVDIVNLHDRLLLALGGSWDETRPLPPGWFGENLRVAGLDVNGARIGERWRIGSGAHAVELEVTSPRRPCQTFARWVGGQYGADLERGWVKRFQQAERPGAYLRVLRNGSIRAGDAIEVVSRPDAQPTIAEVFRDGEVGRSIRT